MKKVRILSQPTQIGLIQLDDLGNDAHDELTERIVRLQVRRWRKLRNGTA